MFGPVHWRNVPGTIRSIMAPTFQKWFKLGVPTPALLHLCSYTSRDAPHLYWAKLRAEFGLLCFCASVVLTGVLHRHKRWVSGFQWSLLFLWAQGLLQPNQGKIRCEKGRCPGQRGKRERVPFASWGPAGCNLCISARDKGFLHRKMIATHSLM